MKNVTIDPNKLWNCKDLAQYLQRSADTIRHDVMNGTIPFIKIGRMVRFDKRAIDEHLNIKYSEPAKPHTEIKIENIKKKSQEISQVNESIAWLNEKARLHPYAELNIRMIIHEGKIKRIERTVMEKI